MCLFVPSYPDEVFVKLQNRRPSVSADFLAKRTFFVFLLGKIRPQQMLGSRCFINGRIKRRSGERFPWHCHLPACFNKIKNIGFGEQDAEFAYFLQIFLVS